MTYALAGLKAVTDSMTQGLDESSRLKQAELEQAEVELISSNNKYTVTNTSSKGNIGRIPTPIWQSSAHSFSGEQSATPHTENKNGRASLQSSLVDDLSQSQNPAKPMLSQTLPPASSKPLKGDTPKGSSVEAQPTSETSSSIAPEIEFIEQDSLNMNNPEAQRHLKAIENAQNNKDLSNLNQRVDTQKIIPHLSQKIECNELPIKIQYQQNVNGTPLNNIPTDLNTELTNASENLEEGKVVVCPYGVSERYRGGIFKLLRMLPFFKHIGKRADHATCLIITPKKIFMIEPKAYKYACGENVTQYRTHWQSYFDSKNCARYSGYFAIAFAKNLKTEITKGGAAEEITDELIERVIEQTIKNDKPTKSTLREFYTSADA
ncbi:hypothetical protein JQC92_13795 [Shewanella sp. 202IG2-18]|uniref:hypothetical protein n=1 Tax=Parashewanella hymeniacidonis TaxID=2807618 RepID=UPI00195F583F|nr:hypothetical protein [Parashewanella hymeniacidonis]MBM7073090.1 hypothetical protein [Parashewanella hymeniacidonis]